MKRLVLAACLSMLAGGAWAEPREIPSEGTIELVMGQAKTFEFKDPVGEIYFAPKNVVEAQPQSDRQFTITPLTSGMTPAVCPIQLDIVVAPEPGHIVKFYGDTKNADFNAGYSAVYCTETTCERPDRDLPKPTTYSVGFPSSGFPETGKGNDPSIGV
ncbi:hypothetical protein [Bradyrhizobium sp. JR3.5]